MTSPAASVLRSEDERRTRLGLTYGLAAYLWWGFVVVYFKLVASVPPLEVLAHRVVWSLVLLGTLLGLRGRWKEGLAALRDLRSLRTLLLSTTLIAINWFTFIWAVTTAHVVQASLGYFINPLVNVLLGFVFLHERLRRLQWVSVGLAAAAVVLMTARMGQLPVVALVLATSFGFYGLLRKTMRVDGLVGLTVETTLLLPIAVAYLVWLWRGGNLTFGHDSRGLDLLLVAAGAVTALPLLWFANAARRLDYATVGLLQYIAPSLQFLCAVAIFGEPLVRAQLVSFAIIWVALGLYSWDALRTARARRRLRRA